MGLRSVYSLNRRLYMLCRQSSGGVAMAVMLELCADVGAGVRCLWSALIARGVAGETVKAR